MFDIFNYLIFESAGPIFESRLRYPILSAPHVVHPTQLMGLILPNLTDHTGKLIEAECISKKYATIISIAIIMVFTNEQFTVIIDQLAMVSLLMIL